MDEKKKRLFIAIGLSDEIHRKLDELQQHLRKFARDAKWVKVDGIHLTLKFLGYVDPSKIVQISNSLKPISQSEKEPFSVSIQGCGFFPNSRRPNVLWAGVSSGGLQPLQAKIEDAMEALGFERENRAFTPHLTLARFRDSHGLTPLILETEKWKESNLGTMNVSEFILFESILQRQGAEYHKLEVFPFP